MLKPIPRPALLLAALLLSSVSFARAEPAPAGDGAEAAKPTETLSETHHTLAIGGRTLRYRALAGDVLLGPEGKPKARMFYVAYLAEGAGKERPLTFLFNGGPGSAAVWLHLGAFGPLRVPVDAEGIPGPQPWSLVPNPESLLDLTDLVFIDPISTGYSRALPGQDEKAYHEFHADIESIGDMIRLFVTRHERWGAPVFLAGESYGTTRAAGIADYLQRRYSLPLSGVVMLSPALNVAALAPQPGNDLPFPLGLPAYTAAAWYHKKLAPELQADYARAAKEAQEFAFGAYSDALFRGDELPTAKRREIVAQMARLTGLDPDDIERDDLRVPNTDFIGKLLQKEKKTIGLLDARYVGEPNYMAGTGVAPNYPYATIDPAFQVDGVFTATMNRYLREELKYRSELPYEGLSQPIAPGWDSGSPGAYLYVGDNLRAAMTQNEHLKLFVASGRYDLVTTAPAARYVLAHLGLAEKLRKNVTFREYPGGHMMYLHQPSLVQLKADLAAFYAAAAPAKSGK